jgi:uncharacterized protein YbaR (Trm112 family)
MLTPELLQILCCPETHQALTLAEAPLLQQINARITAGSLRNRAGQTVTGRLDGGLVRADGKVLYPIRSEIPVLLIDEGIPLTA